MSLSDLYQEIEKDGRILRVVGTTKKKGRGVYGIQRSLCLCIWLSKRDGSFMNKELVNRV